MMPAGEPDLALVRSLVELDPNLHRVLLNNDPAPTEVRLLEIVQGSPSAGDVLPFRFAPDPSQGVVHLAALIEFSPEEPKRIEAGEFEFPPQNGYEGAYSAAGGRGSGPFCCWHPPTSTRRKFWLAIEGRTARPRCCPKWSGRSS